MWVVVDRCPEPREAVYAAILASLLRRGAVLLEGEWGSSVYAAHGPLYPSPRQGSGKRVAVRLGEDEKGLTRMELVVEARLGDAYTILSAGLALATPLATLIHPALGAGTAAASAAVGLLSMLAGGVDANWCSSLLEEACMEASDYRELVERRHQCRIECREVDGGYACTLAPVSSREVLSASLAILGFNVRGSVARTPGIRVEYRCSGQSCTLIYRAGRLYPRPTIYTAILSTMLVSKLAC